MYVTMNFYFPWSYTNLNYGDSENLLEEVIF